nr:alpha/beta hydrolase [uncultured Gellertiella sp.]
MRQQRLETALPGAGHPPSALAALPVAIDSCPGLFVPAGGEARDQAVLFVSPWGFEEMTTRKFWRVTAEHFSQSGLASLRFDLPGTANALDGAGDATLRDWQEAIVTAAERLRALSGASRILIVAQGLGAALAATVWHRLGSLSGVALIAPVLSGRLYLRELAVWARITDGQPDPEKELKEGRGFRISGFRLPDGIHAGIRAFDIGAMPPPPCPDLLVAARPDRPQEQLFGEAVQAKGLRVKAVSHDGHDRLVGNLNFSEQPQALIHDLVAWSAGLVPDRLDPPALPEVPLRLEGNGFVETPVRFGDGGRLLGTLCEPPGGPRTGATVVLLSTAYHPSAGWGRIGADAARRLARDGVASLRFDAANAGDSPPLSGAPEQILYSDAQLLDVAAALDLVESRGLLPAIVAGRCSGGYLAFRSLLGDLRLKGAVSANPYFFFWDGRKNIEDLLRFVPQSLGNYGTKLFQASTWLRILKGEIAVKHALVNISGAVAKRLLHMSETVLQALPFLSPDYREVQQAFTQLQERRAALSLLYAEGDPGLANLVHHFGERGQKIARFANVSLGFIADTDHNLSTPEAREIFIAGVLAMARRFPPAG